MQLQSIRGEQDSQPPESNANVSFVGDRIDNDTDYRPDQALWSQDNLPDILYAFDRPANWLGRAELTEPPLKTYTIHGQFLRDIPILPDHISPDVEGWRLETWHRFDPRIKKHDLVNRMPPGIRGHHNTDLSMRAQRFRKDANVLGWVAKGGKFAAEKQRLTILLQGAGVPLNLNTTRGISWGTNPYGQPIPVSSKLRWRNCVETLPAQAPVMPAFPVGVNTFPPPPLTTAAFAPVQAPVAAGTGPLSAPPASFTAGTNTCPPIQASSIPVTQAPSFSRTLFPAAPVVSSPSSAGTPPAPPKISAQPQNATTFALLANPIPSHLLDPEIFESRPPGPLPATSSMNPPPRPNQAAPLANLEHSIDTSSNARPPQQLLSNSTSGSGPLSLSLAGALHAISAVHAGGGQVSTNVTTSLAKGTKRNRDEEEQEEHSSYVDERDEQPTKKLRPSAADSKPEKRFRKRFPRAAFGGSSSGGGVDPRPDNFNEWLLQGGSSDVVEGTGFVNMQRIQPARQGLGYHEPFVYYHEADGQRIAAPEDFLHPDGVEAGRRERIGERHRGRMQVVEDQGPPFGRFNFDYYAYAEATPAANPVQYTAQSQGLYLPQANDEASNLQPQDLRDSQYPPLE